jgi:hypothetical protein
MPRRKAGGRRKAKGGRRVHRRRVGGSRFTDFFTKTIPSAAKTVYNKAIKPAGNFIKDHHLLSTVAAMIPHPGGKVGAAGLRAIGLGRRRQRVVGGSRTMMGARRRMHGGLNALNGRLYLV